MRCAGWGRFIPPGRGAGILSSAGGASTAALVIVEWTSVHPEKIYPATHCRVEPQKRAPGSLTQLHTTPPRSNPA